MGDFNATLNVEEMRGVNSIAGPDENFKNCIEDVGLRDLPYTGCYYTWTNRRKNDDAIVAKLDRVLVNGSWVQNFPESKAHFFEPITSDHCCALVSL